MGGTVFISHSKRDAHTVAAFCNIFARTNVKAYLAEFEQYQIPPWSQIKSWVTLSNAVFVLLSPHLSATPYTQNWVSYEVGLACAPNKPVWVYERWNEPVHFPIPYLTDYLVYDPTNRQNMDEIKRRVESYDPSPSFAGLVLGALIGAAVSGGVGAGIGGVLGAAVFQQKIAARQITCPYDNCHVQFKLHNVNLQHLTCPACRQGMTFNLEASA